MNDLQECLLKMMSWFDDFALKHTIRYYIVAGTVLGAIRHKGFIPWDDDIDVGLPRSDYERFIELMKTQHGRYQLETPYSDAEDYRYTWSKLYDTNTTLIERSHPVCKRGVFIDIFPLDGIGSTYSEAVKNNRIIRFYQSILLTRRCAIRPNRAWYKNASIYASRLIPESFLNTKKLARKVDSICSARPFDESEFVGNLMGAYGNREIVPKEVFGKPTRYSFETISVSGPQFATEYLEHLYGDWMTLPPVEKRGVQHDYVYLSLEESYLID